MERVFDEYFPGFWPRRFRRGWGGPGWWEQDEPFEGEPPSVDVIERDDEILVHAELPGVDKDDLEVMLADDVLTIKASTGEEKTEEKGEYYRREIVRGAFSRTVRLPTDVDAEHAKSKFKNGVLEVKAPKLKKSRRRVIEID
ncbi:MAG: Hsp20/alpha crystallin family protein [Pseudomonadota bacterium]|nr:Hsp20/alpha crystallin family protein [Pseudomonadota bacterium]